MSKLTTEAKRIEAAVRFAQVIDGIGLSAGLNRDDALHEAQEQKITVLNALRARILLRVAYGSAEVVSQWLKAGELRGALK